MEKKDTVLDPYFLQQATKFLVREWNAIQDKLSEPHIILAESKFVDAVETLARISKETIGDIP